MAETDVITIRIAGPKNMRQRIVKKLYEFIHSEDGLEEIANPEVNLMFESTMSPHEAEYESILRKRLEK